MPSTASRVARFALALLLCLAWGAAIGARGDVTVSTTDGLDLVLSDAGAFNSMTVGGYTVPVLGGPSGGFFIIPMDGVALNYQRKTFYAGTQLTGTATLETATTVRLMGTAQQQSFNILITGGLPYLLIDGTVTGDGSDHAFLLDFRLPVDANGWTWGNRINQPETIDTSSIGNWYFANDVFRGPKHPYLSINPYGAISRTTSPAMGLSLTPLFYPPQAYAIQYNSQFGFRLEFELGTTPKTLKHPNTAEFHFVLYRHNPAWGQRSAVERFQGFFPAWFDRTVSGGNWFLDQVGHDAVTGHDNLPPTPEDFRLKFGQGTRWDDDYTIAHGILTLREQEPWAWHGFTTDPALVEAETADTSASWSGACHCPGNRGLRNPEAAQAVLNSAAQNPDGSYVGPDDPGFWADPDGTSWRWMLNPDPDTSPDPSDPEASTSLQNWRHFTPGTTAAGNLQFREWYYQWEGTSLTAPSVSNQFSGLFHSAVGDYWFDATNGYRTGWAIVHNFTPAHWAYYDYSPGIYWGGFGNGLVTMYGPLSNVKLLKRSYEQMHDEGRVVYADMNPAFENALAAPFLDTWGVQAAVSQVPVTDQALMRSLAGPKPLSFLYGHYDTSGNGHPATEAEIKAALPFAIYPGAGHPDYSTSDSATEYENLRSVYQQYMPVFDALDAAGWHPITAAHPADATQILERFGPDASGAIYYVLRAVSAGAGTVTVSSSDLGWLANPSVTVTALLGAAPSTSFSGGNLVLGFGSLAAGEVRVVKLVYNSTPTVPAADFTATPTSDYAPVTVFFSDTSSHVPTAWYWTFGDGSVSTAHNPSHRYEVGGRYTVSLTASNSHGQDTATKDRYLTLTGVPLPDFAFYRVWGVMGTETTAEFRDQSASLPARWSWQFGDGRTSTLANPTHTYTAPGVYTVALTASNPRGTDTCTKTDLVHILPIVADFAANHLFGSPPFAVTFTDKSVGTTATHWSWAFGDGSIGASQNPTHIYFTGGSYTVSLSVTNIYGTDTKTRENYITVSSSAPVAGFTGTPTTGPVPLVVAFTDTSANFPTSWSWTFGDGGVSTARNPSHTFGDTGSYTVALTAQNPLGANTLTRAGYISVTPPTAPVANFTAAPTSGQAPLLVHFTDTSSGLPTSWTWDFGDGGASAAQNPSHTYASEGMYTVILTATNAQGSNSKTRSDCITVTPPPPAPVASFTAVPSSGSAPLPVTFTDTSTGAPTAWYWAFGDGGTSTARNVLHTYNNPGNFTATLTVVNGGGSDSATTLITVSPVAPVADFTGSQTTGVIPLTVNFTDTTAHSPTSWSWDFGDGGASTAHNPSHIYAQGGAYTVALTAANAGGTDTCTKTDFIKACTFPDVAPDAWGGWQSVEACRAAGIVGGYPDGRYHPDESVSRAQMAGFISRTLAIPSAVPEGPPTPHFPDVPTDHWAYKYIEYAYANAIVAGYPGGNYAPDVPVDRGQMAAFIARAIVTPHGEAGLAGYTPPATPSFPDVPTHFWTYKHVEYLKEHGIVGGYWDGLYHPEIVCTRIQMAVFINRAFGL